MRVFGIIILVLGFLILFLSGLGGLIIVGVGPGSVERAIAALAAAVAGTGMAIAGIKLARSS